MGGAGIPITLVLSDQSFPPILDSGSGKENNCIKIVRVEDGNPMELADLALEIFPKGLPDNSIILLGSGTHLLRAGSSGYVRSWLAAAGKVSRLGRSVQVCPLMPIMDEISPGTIYRSIIEVYSWCSDVFGSDSRGLGEVWSRYICDMRSCAAGGHMLSTPQVYSLPFPVDLTDSASKLFAFSSNSTCPDTVAGLDRKAIDDLLTLLISTLNRDFRANLVPEMTLPREQTATQSSKELTVCLMGGSHAGHTKPHLTALGAKVIDLSQPGWVCSTKSAQQLMSRFAGTDRPEGTVYVFDVLGNSSVRFLQSDDSDSLPVKMGGGGGPFPGNVFAMGKGRGEKALGPLTILPATWR